LAIHIALLAREKKAEDIVVLDMRKACNFCDYFVLLSGESMRQVNSFAEAITGDLRRYSVKSLSKISSYDESGWVVLDFSSVVVHVFYAPKREFYALEHLWQDARKVALRRKTKRNKPD
jgi:ribosome-associated protein